jgi:DNA polymerase-3 subunit delta
VDGIVKGLKQADWPTDNWQALHRLAMLLCRHCMAQPAAVRGPAR